MSKKRYEFVPIYRCRNCQEIVGSMGETYYADKVKDGYSISEREVLERLESYSNKTRIHKDCMGVCEVIRFDRKD